MDRQVFHINRLYIYTYWKGGFLFRACSNFTFSNETRASLDTGNSMRIILEQNRALLWNCVSNKEVNSMIKCRRALPRFIAIKRMNINEMLSWLPRCCCRHGYPSVGNKMAADVNSSSTFDSTSRLLSNLHSDRERSLARSSIGNCTDLSLVWPPLSSITIIAEDLRYFCHL